MTGVREDRQLRFERPGGSTALVLVRHGESIPARADAAFDLLDGHGNPPLAPAGLEQAELLAERLGTEAIAAVYVSTLVRTVQTAAPLAARLGLEVVVEPDLREVHLGEWEGGAYRRHILDGHPLVTRLRAEERWDVIPGGEPATAFESRVQGALRRIVARHADQTVVIVSHGGVIGAILSLASGARPFAFIGADNASISNLVVAGKRQVVRGFNDVSHLRALSG